MNLRFALFGVCFLVMMSGCLIVNLSYYSLIEAINKQRPMNKHISTFGLFNRWEMSDNIREYRRIFPSTKLFLRYKIGLIGMIAGFLSFALCLFSR